MLRGQARYASPRRVDHSAWRRRNELHELDRGSRSRGPTPIVESDGRTLRLSISYWEGLPSQENGSFPKISALWVRV